MGVILFARYVGTAGDAGFHLPALWVERKFTRSLSVTPRRRRLVTVVTAGLLAALVGVWWWQWGWVLSPPHYSGRVVATGSAVTGPMVLIQQDDASRIWVWLHSLRTTVRRSDGGPPGAAVGERVRVWGVNEVMTTSPGQVAPRLIIVDGPKP